MNAEYVHALNQATMHCEKAQGYAQRAASGPLDVSGPHIMTRVQHFYCAATEMMRAVTMLAPFLSDEDPEVAAFVRARIVEMTDNTRAWFNCERSLWEQERAFNELAVNGHKASA